MDYFKDKEYVTRSMLLRLLQDSNTFTRWWNGEYEYPETMPMRLGSIAHDYVFNHLAPEEYNKEYKYEIVDNFKLNSNVGKKYYNDVVSKLTLPWVKAGEHDELMRHLDAAVRNDVFIEYFKRLESRYWLTFEELFTGEIDGVKVKVKADIVCRDVTGEIAKVVDYKTSSDISKFNSSAYAYGYDLQAAMYSKVTGLNLHDDVFDFIVSDKKTDNVKVFKTYSGGFVKRSNNRLKYSIDRYKMWRNGDLLGLNTIVL